jgi:hypothetical protein
MDRKFKIDVFELGFLAEACIPQVPIARTMFWHDMIDKYYYEMGKDEADRLHEWISRNDRYKNSLEKHEDTQIFDARYRPDNQYQVKTKYKGKIEKHIAFKYKDAFYVGRNKSLLEEYIIGKKKI